MTADGKALETRVCPVRAMLKPATPVTSSVPHHAGDIMCETWVGVGRHE